jgi:5-methylcytosine-specific restriction endonuclease McrA
MRIPRDIPLAVYIKRLIAAGKIEQFYFTEDWKELRQVVLDFFHNECQDCLAKGIYTKAECVHHHNEVRKRPDLALSRYYTNPATGQTEPNLIPLCNACHNIRHPEKALGWKIEDRFMNEEKW